MIKINKRTKWRWECNDNSIPFSCLIAIMNTKGMKLLYMHGDYK